MSRLAIIFFIMNLSMHNIHCQNIVISNGTKVNCLNGMNVIRGNLINNGSFDNVNNIIVFSGSIQSIGGNLPCAFSNMTIEDGSTTTVTTSGQTISGVLLCNGTLNSNGNVTLLSTKLGTALIDGGGSGQIQGNIIMQRYFPLGFGYKYLSSPFQSATVNEFADDIDLGVSNTLVYRYDENRNLSGIPLSGWVNYKSTSNILNPMVGYAVNLGASIDPVTLDVAGVVNNGSLNTTIFNHNNPYTTGFNLVGNPYPSPIDWDSPSGWVKTNIDNSLYFFKADTVNQFEGTYVTYINGLSSDELATNIITSMQGFIVHVSDGVWPVSGTLTFNNDVRVNDITHGFVKSDVKNEPPFFKTCSQVFR